MTSVVETLIAFVGIMLVLALVAQSLQELIKVTFVPKSRVAVAALRGLIREAAAANGQMDTDGDDILGAVIARLQALGQKGFGKKGIRLDTLNATLLRDLIGGVSAANVSGLKALSDEAATHRLKTIAKQAGDWYQLAMGPQNDRYRRRMRALALATSAAVVIAANANAFRLFKVVRNDPTLRASLVAQSDTLRTAEAATRALQDSLQLLVADTPDTAAASPVADSLLRRLASRTAQRDSIANTQLARVTEVLGVVQRSDFGHPAWWLGILFSTFLVSLGAPFWHDALESLFAFKSKLRVTASNLARQGEGQARTDESQTDRQAHSAEVSPQGAGQTSP